MSGFYWVLWKLVWTHWSLCLPCRSSRVTLQIRWVFSIIFQCSTYANNLTSSRAQTPSVYSQHISQHDFDLSQQVSSEQFPGVSTDWHLFPLGCLKAATLWKLSMDTSGPSCWSQSQGKGPDTVKFSHIDVVGMTKSIKSTWRTNPKLVARTTSWEGSRRNTCTVSFRLKKIIVWYLINFPLPLYVSDPLACKVLLSLAALCLSPWLQYLNFSSMCFVPCRDVSWGPGDRRAASAGHGAQTD